MKKSILLFFIVFATTAIAQQNSKLPSDPNARTGKLDNGLTYYIRYNKTPQNRADFYIAQNVGSMQEEDSQSGLAHFLEHMAFNGTKHFPDKAMLDYLQNNGIKFGTNINAYTSFDETVYYISDVPTGNINLLDSCLLVLYDWSSGIALEDEAIESERGVIREEWRTRGGAQQRLWDQLLPAMYPGSKYSKRMPIGSIEVINNFKPEEIRSYYKKWYRPDLQGIIIVGDVDVDAMEKRIIDLFSDIPLNATRAERIHFPVPNNKEPIITIATDPEARSTSLMMFYKHNPLSREVKNTLQGYVNSYIMNAAATMLNIRFEEIIQKPDAPFTRASAYDGDYFVAKTKDAWTVVASCSEEKIDEALAAVVRESERVKKYGFTVEEYNLIRTSFIKSFEDLYNNREKQTNSMYSSEFVRAFIDGEPLLGIENEYKLIQSIASQISVDDINKAIKNLIGDDNLVIAITGPQKEGLVYPTGSELQNVIKTVQSEKIEPYEMKIINEPLISSTPTPGKITKIESDEDFDATVWSLSNGIKVILKKTDFKDDQILMIGSSFGGTSKYATSDPINSKMVNQVINLGGVGNFSATDLSKLLSDKTVMVKPEINLTSQHIRGSSSIKDFETMLQLVYLYFISPRSDNEAFTSFLQRTAVNLKNQEADPQVAFTDSLEQALYVDNQLAKRLKSEDLKLIDYNRIMEMYKQQFNNPGSFVFTFVGNIDNEYVKPIVENYLASIPGKAVKGEFVKVPMDLKKGMINNTFEREMQNPKATVFNAYTGQMERTQKNTIIMSMFDQILDIVYTEKIREDEGGTYGVSTSGSISRYPEGQTVLQIAYDTDPKKANYLNEIVSKELNLLAQNGPKDEDFNYVLEYMKKNYNENIKKNGYWMGQINSKYFYDEDTHTNYMEILQSVTPKDIQAFAKSLLSQGNEAVVIMMPKK